MKAIPMLSLSAGACRHLSREEEAELAARRAGGDLAARRTLIESQFGWGLELFRRYRKRFKNQENELLSCIMEGIIVAVDRFDPARETRLTTLTAIWARNRIQRSIRKEWGLIRVPTNLHDALGAERRGRPVPGNPQYLKEARLALAAGAMGLARSAPEEDALLQLVAPESEEEPEGLDRLESSIGRLPDRWALVVRLRFGMLDRLGPFDGLSIDRIRWALDNLPGSPGWAHRSIRFRDGWIEPEGPLVQPQIGAILGVTRSRIQQVEKKSLARLRRLMGAR